MIADGLAVGQANTHMHRGVFNVRSVMQAQAYGGTFVNGKKVEGVLPLQKGDAISLSKSGQEIFQFAD